MIDLSALEQALGAIEEVGKGELTFQIASTTMTLRPLMPAEEVAVEQYAQVAFEGLDTNDTPERAVATEFLDRYKHAVLSFAIVAVGDQEFREPYVATGEQDDHGNPVRIQTHVAIRNMVERWTRPLLLAAFVKYGDLMQSLELQAEKSIKWNPADLKAEIERVEKRLEELKAEFEHREKVTPKDSVTDRLRSIAEASDLRGRSPIPESPVVGEEEASEAHATAQAPGDSASTEPEPRRQPAPEPKPSHPTREAAPSGPRRSALPTRAAPPSRPAPEPPPPPKPPTPDRDSFGDTDDALAAEQARLLEARRQGKIRPPVPEQAETPARKPRRQPPHRKAANTRDAVVDRGGGEVRSGRPTPDLPEEGAALRTETTTLSDREPVRKGGQVEINPTTSGQSRNPRFKPRGG